MRTFVILGQGLVWKVNIQESQHKADSIDNNTFIVVYKIISIIMYPETIAQTAAYSQIDVFVE